MSRFRDALKLNETLNGTLDVLGYTTRPARGRKFAELGGRKDILKDGRVVFTGTADQTWAWLREQADAEEA